MFVSQASQKLAANVGFVAIKDTPYPELLDSVGKKFYDDLYHSVQLCVYKLWLDDYRLDKKTRAILKF